MRPLLLALAVLALIRLPFLNHPIQGDDIYYLAGARHAQIDPLHPHHARYVFLGQSVDMRGHPHPPGNAWFLGGLLAVWSGIQEVRFHASWLLFSLIALAAMWSLSRRFAPRLGVWPALLFLATPAFVVNGNSLEADVPFLALWLASFALWIRAVDFRSTRWLWAACAALALAALYAYQSVAAIPILGLYLWIHARNWRPAWLVLLTPAFTLGGWQLFERMASGDAPAAVLAGHFHTYNLQSLGNKLRNAAALTAHLAWVVGPLLAVAAFVRVARWIWALVIASSAAAAFADAHPLFWASFGIGVLVLLSTLRLAFDTVRVPAQSCRQPLTRQDARFLSLWVLLFFGFALAVFFAGSARYLLPLSPAVALLIARRLEDRPKLLAAGFAAQLLLGLGLAVANYGHWAGYRDFVALLEKQFETQRVWISAEWGLRYYAENAGGLPLIRGQAVQPGEIVLSCKLSDELPYNTAGGVRVELLSRPIVPPVPLRLFALDARSAWSSAARGLRPFDVGTLPADVVSAHRIVEKEPELSYLPMDAPQAEWQIAGGVYGLEGGRWRWMSDRAVFLLKPPPAPTPLVAEVHVPEQARGRTLTLLLDGAEVARFGPASPGAHTLRSPPLSPGGPVARVALAVDATFRVDGDRRDLGVIVSAVGFR